jgi:hypothetical protein
MSIVRTNLNLGFTYIAGTPSFPRRNEGPRQERFQGGVQPESKRNADSSKPDTQLKPSKIDRKVNEIGTRTAAQRFTGKNVSVYVGLQKLGNHELAIGNKSASISASELIRLTGGLSDSKITVSSMPATMSHAFSAKVDVESPGMTKCQFTIRINNSGTKSLYLNYIASDKTTRLLPQIFVLQMMRNAEQMKFSKLSLEAQRIDTTVASKALKQTALVGFQVFPQLGFDGYILDERVVEGFNHFLKENSQVAIKLGFRKGNVTATIDSYTRVLDLIFDKNGTPIDEALRFWKRHGQSYDGSIDFDKTKKSYKVYQAAFKRFGLHP